MLIGQALAIAGFVSYRRGDFSRAEELFGDASRQLSELVGREPAAIPIHTVTLLVLGDIAVAQEQFAQAAMRSAASSDSVFGRDAKSPR